MTLRKSNWSDLAKTTSNPRLHKWRNMSTPVKNISKMFSRVNLLISHFQTFKCSVNVSIMILSKNSSKMNLISSHLKFGENYILSDLNSFFSAQNFNVSFHSSNLRMSFSLKFLTMKNRWIHNSKFASLLFFLEHLPTSELYQRTLMTIFV